MSHADEYIAIVTRQLECQRLVKGLIFGIPVSNGAVLFHAIEYEDLTTEISF